MGTWPPAPQLSTQQIAYAAAITPAPANGLIMFVGTLTGPITLNAPTGTFQAGQFITFVFVQDAVGSRMITLDPIYHGNAIPDTASSTTTVTYFYDGTVWREYEKNLTL